MNFMGRRTRASRYATRHALGIALAMALGSVMLHALDSGSQVAMRELHGQSLSHSLIGTDPVRKLAVYLPAGYENAALRYPVIYYLPNPIAKFDEKFYSGQVRDLLDRAVATAEIDKVIFVAVDMERLWDAPGT